MKVRHVLAALASAGAVLAVCAAPAFAAGPPVPAGCTFNQATGILTCTSTTTAQTGPFTTATDQGLGLGVGVDGTSGYYDPASTTFGGVTGVQICNVASRYVAPWTEIAMVNMSLAVTTTTITERHGLQGKVFDTSTSTSVTLSPGSPSGISCA